MAIFIMLDVGGTEIKGGVFDASGSLLSGIRKFPAKAGKIRIRSLKISATSFLILAGASRKKN